MTPTPTGFLLHPAAALHDPGWGHPEHQGRLPALAQAVGRDMMTLHGRVEQVEGRLATREELERVHPPAHLDAFEAAADEARRSGVPVLAGEEVPFSGASWEAIMGSCGSALLAAEEVAEGRLRNAFVATRPPGHHASEARAMGFCSVNHVAVVARHLQAIGAADRVAIIDWDVHHGNGTQDIFYRDPSVYYLSIHQWPLYPGTGAAEERGEGAGIGTTRNVPVPEGTEGARYIADFEGALREAAAEFSPDFVLISAGYDGLAPDPLGGLRLEPADFHVLARRVLAWAEDRCSGRAVALLEGGYAPVPTGAAVAATIRAFAGVEMSG